MSISISNQQIYLHNGVMPEREQLRSQQNKAKGQKVLFRDMVEFTNIKENKESVIERVNHTVMQSASAFSDTRAGILGQVREDKGEYGYAEVVNACGLSYAKLYAEIEERHSCGEQFYNPDGTILTKEDEIVFLDKAFANEVAWQMSCTKVAVQRDIFSEHLQEMPYKEMSELEESFYKTKNAYMSLYEENKQAGKTMTLQNYIFGNERLYLFFDRVRNLG